jgi:hypothetical protein
MDSLDLTDEPHPTFLLQGHILNIGGDALSWGGGVDIDGPYCQTSFIIDMHMISRHDLYTLDLDTHFDCNPEEALVFFSFGNELGCCCCCCIIPSGL